jgi:adenylosuccinate lyase
MQQLWSDSRRAQLWRGVWLAVAQAQQELGVNIPQAAIDGMRANINTTDFAAVAKHEKRLRHDVMAHVHAFGESAPAAQGFIHLGMTSQDVVCNADALILRDALQLIANKFARVIDRIATFAAKQRDLACLGFTHFQPAQPLTLGKRDVVGPRFRHRS